MNKLNSEKHVLVFAALALVSFACSGQISAFDTPSHPSVETLVAGTIAVYTENAPVTTVEIMPITTSVAVSPTAEKFGEVYVYTVVDNVNLRTNPGTLFQVSRVMPNNTRLRLLGQIPGGEWLSVRNDESVAGWVNKNVVSLAYDGPPPPVIEPTGVYLVTGSVFTELGTPVSGVGFAIIQNDRRTDATTDENGHFHAYLPIAMSGTWRAEYVSISCTSNTMDESCNCVNNRYGTTVPLNATVALPQTEELTFIWK